MSLKKLVIPNRRTEEELSIDEWMEFLAQSSHQSLRAISAQYAQIDSIIKMFNLLVTDEKSRRSFEIKRKEMLYHLQQSIAKVGSPDGGSPSSGLFAHYKPRSFS